MPNQFTSHHHHEVQEMMGRMPSWVTRWASTGLLLTFLLLLLTAHLMRFPDQVPAAVQITRPLGAAPGQPRIQATVAVEQAAAVRPGQAMLIDLQAYPARQYGYLPATVSQVQAFTTADVVQLQVRLPQGWRTTTGRLINYQPVLKGKGAITVSETSLLRRIYRY